MGSDACQAALRAYGKGIKRLGIITPYMPIGDKQVYRFFTECGFEVVNLLGLKCKSPMLIAHESKKTLRDAINTATYWYALRQYGIKDRVHGWGSLLAAH